VKLQKLKKNTDRVKVSQKDIDLHNNANLAAACFVQYVNTKSVEGPTCKSLKHMDQQLADEAATNVEEGEGDTSEDKETDDYNFAKTLRKSAERRSKIDRIS
jgi:hypothetical protein